MEQRLLHRLAAGFRERQTGHVVDVGGLRRENISYMLVWLFYYAWVVAFATWWTTASPAAAGEDVFGALRSAMHVVNLLSSAVCVFVINPKNSVKTARVGAAAMVFAMLAYMFIPSSAVRAGASVAIALSMGVVNISILMPYIFVLNNTEKLYSMAGSSLLICLIGLFLNSHAAQALSETGRLLFSFIMLLMGLWGILFFRPETVTTRAEDNGKNAAPFYPKLFLTLLVSCLFAILYKGIGKGILDLTMQKTSLPVNTWYLLGGVFGSFLYVFVFWKVKRSIFVAANLSFSMLSLGLLFNALAKDTPGLSVPFAAMLGIGNSFGVITMYYMLGVVAKKYNSLYYTRVTIVTVGICGGAAGVLAGNLIVSMPAQTIIASAVVSTVMLLFLTFAPLLPQSRMQEWTMDAEKAEIDNDRSFLFQKYKLSRREIDVCKLLLQGYTMRQISGILSLAYPTVNTYCTSAYRKLKINSRTELMVMFRDYMSTAEKA